MAGGIGQTMGVHNFFYNLSKNIITELILLLTIFQYFNAYA